MSDANSKHEPSLGLPRAAEVQGLEIRRLETYAELIEVEDIQQEVWGMEPVEIVPAAHLRAVDHAGGLIAGAFKDGEMVGFVYGFLAAPTGRAMRGPGMHSHMLAVRHGGRGLGVGKALKWYQRDWCLARGIEWVCWTFDPLQAKNARLNLFHLAAIGSEYHVDFYGPMTGHLGGSQETDRLLALWLLNDPGVVAIGLGQAPRNYDLRHPTAGPDLWLAGSDGEGHDQTAPGRLLDAGAVAARVAAAPSNATLRIAAPHDATTLLSSAPQAAAAWRHNIRVAMTTAMAAGFYVVDFVSGAYSLRRREHE